MLSDAKEGMKLSEQDAKAYHATLAAFYKAMLSGDYDENNIMASIKEVLSGTGYEGNIDVGDMHLTFRQGYVLERDANGMFKVDGKEFKDETTALNAMAASQLGDLLTGKKTINTETGAVTYHGAVDTTVKIDVDNKKYEASFSNGGAVSATSKDLLTAAIQTYTLLHPEDFS